MGTGFEEYNLYYDPFTPQGGCECCRPRMTSMTMTTSTPHKWTEEEIKAMILDLAERLANSNWWTRGDRRRALKHWTDKLKRFNEAKEEFKTP